MLSSQHIHFFSKSVAVFFSSPHNTKYKYRTPTHPLFNGSRKIKPQAVLLLCAFSRLLRSIAFHVSQPLPHRTARASPLSTPQPQPLQSVAWLCLSLFLWLWSPNKSYQSHGFRTKANTSTDCPYLLLRCFQLGTCPSFRTLKLFRLYFSVVCSPYKIQIHLAIYPHLIKERSKKKYFY